MVSKTCILIPGPRIGSEVSVGIATKQSGDKWWTFHAEEVFPYITYSDISITTGIPDEFGKTFRENTLHELRDFPATLIEGMRRLNAERAAWANKQS